MSSTSDRRRIDFALLLLRLIVGGVFIAHGGQKVFVVGHANVTNMFTGMGVPSPGIAAYVNMWVELLGGLALVFGVITRLAALLLAINMGVAIYTVHLSAGFFAPKGFEYPLTLLVCCVVLLLTGSGAFGFDARLRSR